MKRKVINKFKVHFMCLLSDYVYGWIQFDKEISIIMKQKYSTGSSFFHIYLKSIHEFTAKYKMRTWVIVIVVLVWSEQDWRNYLIKLSKQCLIYVYLSRRMATSAVVND